MRTWNLAMLGVLLAGCASNVHGEFTCQAPGGTCAPLRSIDESAVREAGGLVPNAASIDPAFQQRSSAPILAAYSEAPPPERTGERVLRVVFPAHVDVQGIYHESAAVHAVVQSPRWSEAQALPVKAARTVAEPKQQAEASVTRGSTLATMDEVVAARAEREAPTYQQYRSFSQPASPGSGGGGVVEERGFGSTTPANSVANVMARAVAAPVPRQVVHASKTRISGSTTAELNASSLRRTEADLPPAPVVDMGSGNGGGAEAQGLAPASIPAPASASAVGVAASGPADEVKPSQQYEMLVKADPGTPQ